MATAYSYWDLKTASSSMATATSAMMSTAVTCPRSSHSYSRSSDPGFLFAVTAHIHILVAATCYQYQTLDFRFVFCITHITIHLSSLIGSSITYHVVQFIMAMWCWCWRRIIAVDENGCWWKKPMIATTAQRPNPIHPIMTATYS